MKKWGDAERKEILISALQTAKYTSPKRKKRRAPRFRADLHADPFVRRALWKKLRLKHARTCACTRTQHRYVLPGTIGAAISVFFIHPLTHAASGEKSPSQMFSLCIRERTFYWHPSWLYLISATISFNKSSKYVDYGSITESNLVLRAPSRSLIVAPNPLPQFFFYPPSDRSRSLISARRCCSQWFFTLHSELNLCATGIFFALVHFKETVSGSSCNFPRAHATPANGIFACKRGLIYLSSLQNVCVWIISFIATGCQRQLSICLSKVVRSQESTLWYCLTKN